MPIALFLFQLAAAGPAAPDPRALLDRAVAALGGPDRLARLDRWLVEGRGRENLTAELQGRTPAGPTYRPHQEIVAVVRALGRVAWERKTPRNDHSLRWRRFILGPDSSGVVDWNGGFGVMRPRPTSLASRAALMRRIPHLLLAELVAAPIAVESRPRRGGLEVIVVTLPDSERYPRRAPAPMVGSPWSCAGVSPSSRRASRFATSSSPITTTTTSAVLGASPGRAPPSSSRRAIDGRRPAPRRPRQSRSGRARTGRP